MKIILLVSFWFLTNAVVGQSPNAGKEYQMSRMIISDLDSIVSPNGIQENYEVIVGGIRQWVYVRGQNKNNPVILFIHGGPASPMSPVMWTFQRPLEEYFTVVQYDQRAAGKTFNSNDTNGLARTIHIDQYVKDAIELTEQIEKKYQRKKVILVAHSWGTVIAMNAAIKRPDLFYAYVGIGQVINTRDNERVSFQFALDEARLKHNDTAVKELMSIAPYPGNQPITRERIIIARKWPQYYGGLSAYRTQSRYYFYAPLLSPEYDEKDIDAIDQGNSYTLGKILDEFLNVDFKPVHKFPIPIFMFMGRHDYTTPSEPTRQWLDNLDAPVKKGIWFENSAHLIPMEEPGKMLVTLLTEVRPMTVQNSDTP